MTKPISAALCLCDFFFKWAENNNMFLPKDIVNPAMWAREGFFKKTKRNNNHSPTFFLTDLMFESLKRRVLE